MKNSVVRTGKISAGGFHLLSVARGEPITLSNLNRVLMQLNVQANVFGRSNIIFRLLSIQLAELKLKKYI